MNENKIKICLRNMRISNTLLKMGAMAGLTLEQISKIWCRPDYDDTPSLLEILVQRARQVADLLGKSNPIF